MPCCHWFAMLHIADYYYAFITLTMLSLRFLSLRHYWCWCFLSLPMPLRPPLAAAFPAYAIPLLVFIHIGYWLIPPIGLIADIIFAVIAIADYAGFAYWFSPYWRHYKAAIDCHWPAPLRCFVISHFADTLRQLTCFRRHYAIAFAFFRLPLLLILPPPLLLLRFSFAIAPLLLAWLQMPAALFID